MRVLVCCVLLAVVAIAAALPANLEDKEVPQSLYDVDVQGHENVGDREARQFGYGGYHGGYGGYRGGYGGFGGGGYRGGYGGGYGGYRGGYGGYHGGYGGYRGGYGGFHG
ncbi:glycine-rich protein 3-like isoform X1 [Calliphora vicina]|uniref:glycine-rich protein 3-like isoform X1 n=1 Tax=Calliphora vicina TaxID=7373 RepID=UPI00325AF2AA